MMPSTRSDLLPQDALARSALLNVALLAPTVVLGALGLRAGLGVSALYVLKALAAYALCAALILIFIDAHRPSRSFGWANRVTLARVGLVALLLGLVGEGIAPSLGIAALLLGCTAIALDGVDGWLARRTGVTSPFGARFDMEVDALLVMALSVLVWQLGKAGLWVLLAGLLRYVFVAAGLIWRWLAAPLPPSMRRKLICVLQVAGLLVAIAPAVAPPVSALAAAAGLAALCYSFVIDSAWLYRHRVEMR
jgi:phosphatidylglycerophosphate synthase